MGIRITKSTNGGYLVHKPFLSRHRSSSEYLTWEDLGYMIINAKRIMAPAIIAVCLITVTSIFVTIDDLIEDTALPYIYVSSVLVIAFHATSETYLLILIYLGAILFFCGGSVIATIVYFGFTVSGNLALCSRPESKGIFYVYMFFGFLIFSWYCIQGTITCSYIISYNIEMRKRTPPEKLFYKMGKEDQKRKQKIKGKRIAVSLTNPNRNRNRRNLSKV
jgi:hypothetical protein